MSLSKQKLLNICIISWPIILDNTLRMFVILISTWLISCISDNAVSIIATVNIFILLSFNIMECFAQNSMIIINQYLGAKLKNRLNNFILISLCINLIIGTIFFIIFFFYSSQILGLVSSKIIILKYGTNYLKTISYGYPIYALAYGLSHILNAHGETKISMLYSVITNLSVLLVTFILILKYCDKENCSVLEKIAATHMWIRVIFIYILIYKVFSLRILKFQFENKYLLLKEALIFIRLGVINSIESCSYHITQIILTKIILFIGISSLTTRSYILSISGVLEMLAFGFSKGNQIILGKLIGSNCFDDAQNQLKLSIFLCLITSFLVLLPTYFFAYKIIAIFSSDIIVVKLGTEIIHINLTLILLKCISFNFLNALKATIDLKYLTLLFLSLSWLFTIPLCILLFNFYELSVIKIWYIFITEEIIKIFFLKKRWDGKKWKRNLLIETTQ